MKKGDIILLPFPFTDLSGSKLRPAYVLYATKEDVTVSFVTTQIKWKEKSDVIIKPSVQNGIKKDSLIRVSKIATIDIGLVWGRLGSMEMELQEVVNQNLKELLDLN
jgi:mRNA interferase MazF